MGKKKKKQKSKVIYYGHYRLYADGSIERIKKARGTWIGKFLQPYTMPHTDQYYVKLSHVGIVKQFQLDRLLSFHFG